VVGIDPNSDRMLLWSGEHTRVLSMQDLVQAIHLLPERSAGGVRAAQLAAWLRSARIPSRRRTLIAVVVAVCLCGAAVALLALVRPSQGALLSGTALGGALAPKLVLAFAAGIVLGAALIGVWLHRGRRGGSGAPSAGSGEE
jgi:hypothetical protein